MSPVLLEVALALIPLVEGARGNPLALNPRENAVGIYQITPILVKDLQERGHDFYLEDRKDPAKSREMCQIYLGIYCTEKRLGREPDITDLLLTWCAGPNGPMQPRNHKMEVYLERAHGYMAQAQRIANAKLVVMSSVVNNKPGV